MDETSLMDIRELTATDRDAATALWAEAGLVRPWNDPTSDFDRAVGGMTSAVLGAVDAGELAATVMVGHDGHRGWVYYLAVDPGQRRSGLGRHMIRRRRAGSGSGES
jgi:ribosomal protein S18 acetylase RimI-like enzyme